MTGLSFREGTSGDSEDIAQLVNAAYRPVPGAEGWTHESGLVSGVRTNAAQVEKLLHRSSMLVGIHDGKIVACVEIERRGRDAHIGMLAVQPAMQVPGSEA